MQKRVLMPSFFFLLVGFFIIYSCKKTDSQFATGQEQKQTASTSSFTNPKYPMNTRLAQRYYNKLVREQGNEVKYSPVDASKAMRSNEANKKNLVWRKAYEGQNTSSTFVEVPVVYNRRPALTVTLKDTVLDPENKKKLLNGSFDRLLIIKNKAIGEVKQYIISYLPDLGYLNRHSGDVSRNHINKLDKDFQGFIVYKEWDGTPLWFYQVEQGRFISKFDFKDLGVNKRTSNQQTTSNRTAGECLQWAQYCVTYWEADCDNSGDNMEMHCDNFISYPPICESVCLQRAEDDPPPGDDNPPPTDEGFDVAAENALSAQVFSTSITPTNTNVSYSSPNEASVPFDWTVVENDFGLWKVTSYDEAKGYNSANIGAIIYDIQHSSSSISGQTSFVRIPTGPGGYPVPFIYINWQESSTSKSFAGDYKSGTITVNGLVMNFGWIVKNVSNWHKVTVQ